MQRLAQTAVVTAALVGAPLAHADPMNVTIEMHVESFDSAANAKVVRLVAEQAAAHPVSAHPVHIDFGFAPKFVEYLMTTYAGEGLPSSVIEDEGDGVWADEYVQYLTSLGHGVTAHVEYDDLSWVPRADQLKAQLADIEDIGGDPTNASGVAHPDERWVEMSTDAGLTVVSGVVRWAQAGLDPFNPYQVAGRFVTDPALGLAAPCTAPTCHEAAPANWSTADDATEKAQRLAGWRAADTRTFLTDSGSSTDLLVMSSARDASLDCLAASGACAYTTATDGMSAARALAHEVSEDRATYGATGSDSVYITWSTNRMPSDEFIRGFFGALPNQTRLRGVEFLTVAEAAAEHP